MEADNNDEYESFSLDSIEGAYVHAPSWLLNSSFRTTFKLSNSKQFIELSCNNPISDTQKVEELNINGLNPILGNYFQLENFNISSGNYKPRFAPPITNDLIINKLSIKLNQNIQLENTSESPSAYKATIGNCEFFSLDQKTSYKQGDILKAKSFEIVYTDDNLIIQNPTIILRFNDNSGMMCRGSSEKRMFDYQDFWDATGKTDIDWIISI